MSEIQNCRPGEVLIGNSPAIRRIRDQLQKACLTEVPVLITGESGTGKGLVAKLLHDMSERRAHRFLKLSCATLSNRFFDWEFERNSNLDSTDRKYDRPITDFVGGGTIFVDEIGVGERGDGPRAPEDVRVAVRRLRQRADEGRIGDDGGVPVRGGERAST